MSRTRADFPKIAEMLTVAEVARIAKLDPQTILGHIHAEELPAINFGGAGRGARYRMHPADVSRWIESRRHVA